MKWKERRLIVGRGRKRGIKQEIRMDGRKRYRREE